MENENKEVLKINSNEKVTATVSKPYYDKFKDQISIHSKKHVLGGVIAAVSLVTCGGLAAGHFAYKATHPHQDSIEERIIINPELQDKASVTTPVIDEQGNAHTSVSVKNKELNCIGDVEVYIGDWKCNSEEYEIIQGNGEEKPQSFEVVIKKEALEKHEGKISVSPKIEIIKKLLKFEVEDFIEHKIITPDSQDIEIGSHPHAPTVVGLTDGLEIVGWKLNGEEVNLNDFIVTKDTPNNQLVFKAIVVDTYPFDVTFIPYDGCPTTEVVQVIRGNTVKKPNEPVREGYNFQHWNDEYNVEFNFDTEIFANRTLKGAWEKKKFTVTFDSNGGSEVAPITDVEWDTTITAPTEPKRTGYTFSKWTLKGEDFVFGQDGTHVKENITLVAQWDADYVTVSFADSDTAGTIIGNDQKVLRSGTLNEPDYTKKEGHTLQGWYTEKNGGGSQWKFEPDPDATKVEPDSTAKTKTLYANWTKNTYTITFDSNGGSTGVTTTTAEFDSTIDAPTEPTKTGYTLDGWYLDGTKFEFKNAANPTHIPSRDITLVAKWNEDFVTVSFADSDASGTIIGTDQKVLRSGTLSEPDYTKKEGHTLDGWYTEKNGAGDKWVFGEDGTQVEPTTTATTKTLYANWTKNTYTITFDSNGGSTGVTTTTAEFDSTIDAPTEPTKTGYTFTQWELDGSKFNFKNEASPTHIPSRDITLVAKWAEDNVTVSFNTNGGTSVPSQTVLKGSKLIAPSTTYEGHTLENWYTDSGCTSGKEWDFSSSIVDGTITTLYAKWTPNKYTIKFDLNGGTSTVPSDIQNIDYDTVVPTSKKPGDPTRTGYTFAGWYYNGAAFTFGDGGTKVKENINLIAQWTKDEVTVSFNTNGGTSVPSQTVLKGSKLIAPSTTYEGHTLENWYTDSGCTTGKEWNFNSMTVDGTITTLYAKWTPNKYTIKFDLNGGESQKPGDITNIEYDTVVSTSEQPEDPTRTGYTFAGWYYNGALFTFGTTKVKENINLIAQWTKDEVTVSFNSNGGSAVSSQTVLKGSKLVEPLSVKDGYTLEGWYTESGLTNKVDFSSYTATASTTLYAKWTPKTFTVTFDSNGGSSVSPQGNVEYNTTITAPSAPTKSGFTFAGWTHNGTAWNFATDKVTENITLVATWTENVPTTVEATCQSISASGGSAAINVTLKDAGGQTIVCPGKCVYNITFRSRPADNVTVHATTGVVQAGTNTQSGDTVTVTVTYIYGLTSVSGEVTVTFTA